MKKFFIQCLLLMCFTVKGFSSDSCSVPQDSCCCFEFSAEWLYMLSSLDQSYFATEQVENNIPFGDRFANKQRWHSGYRLEALLHFPCACLDYAKARWTHFPEFKDARQVEGNLEAILIHPNQEVLGVGVATINDKTRFYNLEILLGKLAYCTCCLKINLEAGINWSKIDFNENVDYFLVVLVVNSRIANVENESQFWGLGPEVAFNLAYDFSTCFSINARGSTSFLISRKKSQFFDFTRIDTIENTFSADNDPYWVGTPTLDFRIGANYHTPLCFCACNHLNLNIELGYEFIHLIKAVDRIYFVDALNEGSSFVEHQDFTLHGPYVHLGICF